MEKPEHGGRGTFQRPGSRFQRPRAPVSLTFNSSSQTRNVRNRLSRDRRVWLQQTRRRQAGTAAPIDRPDSGLGLPQTRRRLTRVGVQRHLLGQARCFGVLSWCVSLASQRPPVSLLFVPASSVDHHDHTLGKLSPGRWTSSSLADRALDPQERGGRTGPGDGPELPGH